MTGSVATIAVDVKAPAPRPSGRGAPLVLELRSDLRWSPEDASVLDALIEQRPHVGVFVTTAWLSGFFAEPPAGFEPSILVLREGGVLKGMVPLATRRMPTHRRVTLLGGGIGSDRVDLLAARGYEATFSDMFLDWLATSFGRKGFVVELRDVPDDSPLWGAIRRASVEQRLPLAIVPREIHAAPYLALRERSVGASEGLMDGWGPVKSTTKHRRWLERRGELRIELVETADEAAVEFERLADWLGARWGSGASALDHPRAIRFHRHVLPRLLDERRLRMIRLRAGLRPIAAFYGLASPGGSPASAARASRTWWGYYLAGYDREWAGRIHLGQITLAAAIELALADRAAEFDFLKGAERVKYLWPVRERVTVDADVYSSNCGAQLTRARRAAREMVAALARSTCGLFSARSPR